MVQGLDVEGMCIDLWEFHVITPERLSLE